jgi:hypothetical protein
MPDLNPMLARADWMASGDIRPYVFVRPENKIAAPGTLHKIDWFLHEPIYKNPLHLDELPFAEAIYQIEWKSFGAQDLAIPRWVFYDCAAMPGFIAGFAARREVVPEKVKNLLHIDDTLPWCPLSLFIITPTMHRGEWVAYDLCSVNSLLPKSEQYYSLGFMTKAFGLWYANVVQCSGMTQWGSPSLKLHSHFGHLEVIGSYAPLHTHAKTMTYRCAVDTTCWEKFFTREDDLGFLEKYGKTGYKIEPNNVESMIQLQTKIQNQEGPFFLNAMEIAACGLRDPLSIYRSKQERGL